MPLDLLPALGTSGIPLLAATALGLLMAISPCTLATSVAAVLYLGSGHPGRWQFAAAAGLYTLGRMAVYTGLAFGIVWFGLSTREIALFFQQYGERLVAPVLILAGIWMLGLIPSVKWPEVFGRVRERVAGGPERRTGLAAFFLGAFFSLSFCPINVVLFFGLLIPLAYRSGDPLGIPMVFSLASTLPVLAASLILATSARQLGQMLVTLEDLNRWMQLVVGVVFLAIGIWYLPRFFGF